MRCVGAGTILIVLASPPTCLGEDAPGGGGKAVEAREFSRKTVYHSPQMPGYTCWVGAWPMPDGSLLASFTQATGPIAGRPRAPAEVQTRLGWPPPKDPAGYDFTGLDLSNVYLRSIDLGATWT